MKKEMEVEFVSKEALLREFEYLTMKLDQLDDTLKKKTDETSLHYYIKHRIEIQKISDQFRLAEEKWRQGQRKYKKDSTHPVLASKQLSYRSS
ncbi:hypothetical protein RZN22_13670 [Bacillaceae bacterium S4-13-58]